MSEGLTQRGREAKMRASKEKDWDMEEEIQKAFNNTIGAILTYLDEANVGFATKKAVKAELWELCDKKIKGLGLGDTDDEEFNR